MREYIIYLLITITLPLMLVFLLILTSYRVADNLLQKLSE